MLSTQVTPNDFLVQLQKRVSLYDARLILDSAMVSSGIKRQMAEELDGETAKDLCLALIKRGGPAFQAGTVLYRRLHS